MTDEFRSPESSDCCPQPSELAPCDLDIDECDDVGDLDETDDTPWEVFLADDDGEPLPEPGDFWIDAENLLTEACESDFGPPQT